MRAAVRHRQGKVLDHLFQEEHLVGAETVAPTRLQHYQPATCVPSGMAIERKEKQGSKWAGEIVDARRLGRIDPDRVTAVLDDQASPPR
ncbi:hypothetical protein ACGF5M_06620 [Gemmatimonadota bacterium]